MNGIYFAIGCILMVLAIYWGSREPEPKDLARYFGPRPDVKPSFDGLEPPPKNKASR
jgi:hypothetical protein